MFLYAAGALVPSSPFLLSVFLFYIGVTQRLGSLLWRFFSEVSALTPPPLALLAAHGDFLPGDLHSLIMSCIIFGFYLFALIPEDLGHRAGGIVSTKHEFGGVS